jgi:hypothetical protein
MPDLKGFDSMFKDYIQPLAKDESSTTADVCPTLGTLSNSSGSKIKDDKYDNLHYGTPDAGKA